MLGALEEEALRRGINYVYNVVRDHPERVVVHDWFVIRGFRGPDRRRPAQAGRRPARAPRARSPPPRAEAYDPAGEGDHGPGDEESGGYVDVDDHQY